MFLQWYRRLAQFRRLEIIGDEAWVFPRYHHFSRQFLFHGKKPLTTQRFDQILQQLDPTMTSCMFRYGVVENLLDRGYTPQELKEIGDWSTTVMPEIYAQRQADTRTLKKFAEDLA